MSNRLWTDGQVETLRRMIADRKSSGQIAEVMGVSREAVCGKAFRLGLSLKSDRSDRYNQATGEKQRRAPRINPKPERPPFLAATDDELARMAAIPDVVRVASIIDLEDHHCKYPIGDPLTGFCGDGRVRGLPYCETHSARCYRPLNVVPTYRVIPSVKKLETVE